MSMIIAAAMKKGPTDQMKQELLDLNLDTDEIIRNAFQLDIKNYIDSIVSDRTEPPLKRVMDMLLKVQRLEVSLRTLNDDFHANRVFTKSQFTKYITVKDFKEKFTDFHKSVSEELQNHQRSILRLDDQQDDFDNKIKQNKHEIERIWRLYDASKKQVDDCIKYTNRSIDQMTDSQKRFTGDIQQEFLILQKKFKNIEIEMMKSDATVQVNNEQISKIRLDTEAHTRHLKNKMFSHAFDVDKKLKQLKEETEANMMTMATQLNDEFMHMHNRMKQRLLYQIGLIDDPWQEDQGPVMDTEYSQDLNDRL